MLKDVFAILASTPEKLEREISTLSLRQMNTRPAPNKWSVQEVLAHLADVEENAMRTRVVKRRYDRKNPRRSLAALKRQRQANLKWLRKLRPAQLKRKGVHEQVGEITAEEFLNEWAFHDLGHLKQFLEIKRYALYPRIGKMRKFYELS